MALAEPDVKTWNCKESEAGEKVKSYTSIKIQCFFAFVHLRVFETSY